MPGGRFGSCPLSFCAHARSFKIFSFQNREGRLLWGIWTRRLRFRGTVRHTFQLRCFSSTLVFFFNFGVFLQLRCFSSTSAFFSNFGVFLQLRCFSPTSVFFSNFGVFLQLWLFSSTLAFLSLFTRNQESPSKNWFDLIFRVARAESPRFP